MKDRVYTAEMGQPPMDVDGGSAPPMRRPAMKRAAPPMKRPAPKRAASMKDSVYTAEMGQPPQDIDGASAPRYKNGGSVSRRADGIAARGKTNCKMV